MPVSLVAEVGGTVVGHIAFSPVTAMSGAVGAGLAPVAVGVPPLPAVDAATESATEPPHMIGVKVASGAPRSLSLSVHNLA
jgi:hypothetical protein